MHKPLAAVAPSVNALCVARNLTPVGEDVVAPAERGIYSERAEVAYYRGGKARKIYSAAAVGADEGEVYVADVYKRQTVRASSPDELIARITPPLEAAVKEYRNAERA